MFGESELSDAFRQVADHGFTSRLNYYVKNLSLHVHIIEGLHNDQKGRLQRPTYL